MMVHKKHPSLTFLLLPCEYSPPVKHTCRNAGRQTDRQVNRTTLNYLEGKMLGNKLRLFLKHRKIATSHVGLLTLNTSIYC